MRLNHIFASQSKTITLAAFLLGLSSFLSRALGFLRNRLLAQRFGAGEIADIYFAAFKIPDFVYGILIMGGISAVFVPVLAEYFKKDQDKGWELSNNVLNCFLILLILLCSVLAVFSPALIKLVAPGFSAEARLKTAALSRIMFLSPVLFGLSSIFSGILHYFNRFLLYSLAPILYNLGIIFGILFLYPSFGVLGLGYGVILGALLHLLIQVPGAVRAGFCWKPIFNFNYPGLKKIFRLMLPRAVGAASYHINLIVITAIASTLSVGSVAIFNYSNDLQYFPIGIIGVSFALSAFPVLSRAFAAKNKQKFLDEFSSVFRQILFLIAPLAFSMFILRAQLTRLILGTGQFGWFETRLTAASLGVFCLGIPFLCLIPFLSRVFYSLQDTKTPVLIGISAVGLNILLSLFFVRALSQANGFQLFLSSCLKLKGIKDISVVGLALALSISTGFQFFLLFHFLAKKLKGFNLKQISGSVAKIMLSSVCSVLSGFAILQLAAPFLNMRTFLGVLAQTCLAGFFTIFVYIFFANLLKSKEFKTIKSSILG